jgi:hypothetical protein
MQGSLTECDYFIRLIGKEVESTMDFKSGKDFEAYHLAENYAKSLGYNVGIMQGDAPVALSKKAGYISKWRNIDRDEYKFIEGVILSDSPRNSDTQVVIFK